LSELENETKEEKEHRINRINITELDFREDDILRF